MTLARRDAERPGHAHKHASGSRSGHQDVGGYSRAGWERDGGSGRGADRGADGRDRWGPADQYFGMGHKRNHSCDSGMFGFVELDAILGKAEVRIWPLNQVGFLASKPSLSNSP